MSADALSCKCCGKLAKPIGTVDFNKSCIDCTGEKPFPPSGEEVPYWMCSACGFVFSNYMDKWSHEQFTERIYNTDYVRADPPLPGRLEVPLRDTPSYQKGRYIAAFFPNAQRELRILDYGAGGNPGPTGCALAEAGFTVVSYDPFRAQTALPEGRFDLIVAIEVFEHVTDLRRLGSFMQERLARDGLLWIQTLLHPFPPLQNVLDSWYIAPRNGHVSIFTLHALSVFLRGYGINVVVTSAATFGFKSLPQFPNLVFV